MVVVVRGDRWWSRLTVVACSGWRWHVEVELVGDVGGGRGWLAVEVVVVGGDGWYVVACVAMEVVGGGSEMWWRVEADVLGLMGVSW